MCINCERPGGSKQHKESEYEVSRNKATVVIFHSFACLSSLSLLS